MSNELIIDGEHAEVGDRLWCYEYGWGEVEEIAEQEIQILFKQARARFVKDSMQELYRQKMRLVPADAVVIRPDWENAPEGAKSWTVDITGDPGFHRVSDPKHLNDGYWSLGNTVLSSSPVICDEWRESLRLRPEPVKKEPRWHWVYLFKGAKVPEITMVKHTKDQFLWTFRAFALDWYERIDATKED